LGKLLQKQQLLDSETTDLAYLRYKDLISQTREGIKILEKHASFTKVGEIFLEWSSEKIKTAIN
jgi:hypothetical protein